MPIRLNLLAEAQALEDMRRRDPVKRAVAIGIILVSVMVLWSLGLWFKALTYNHEIAGLENVLKVHSEQNKGVLNNLKQTDDINQKLTSLKKLSTNRFLVGNLLDALQQATLSDVQLSRLRLDDSLIFNEEVKPGGNHSPRPATVTERLLLTLDAKDSCAKPGDSIPKFQQKIADAPYFEAMLNKSDPQRVHLKDGSYVAVQMGMDNRPFQPFALECRFPDKTR